MSSSAAPTISVAANTTAATSLQMPPGVQPPATNAAANVALAAEVPPALSPAEVATAIREIRVALADLQSCLQPPPPPPPSAPFTSPSPAYVAPQGRPINQIKWPPSPSPLPTWINTPTYTMAPLQPTVLQPPRPHLRRVR